MVLVQNFKKHGRVCSTCLLAEANMRAVFASSIIVAAAVLHAGARSTERPGPMWPSDYLAALPRAGVQQPLLRDGGGKILSPRLC